MLGLSFGVLGWFRCLDVDATRDIYRTAEMDFRAVSVTGPNTLIKLDKSLLLSLVFVLVW